MIRCLFLRNEDFSIDKSRFLVERFGVIYVCNLICLYQVYQPYYIQVLEIIEIQYRLYNG